jgi:predicted outer membrane lipoprotein
VGRGITCPGALEEDFASILATPLPRTAEVSFCGEQVGFPEETGLGDFFRKDFAWILATPLARMAESSFWGKQAGFPAETGLDDFFRKDFAWILATPLARMVESSFCGKQAWFPSETGLDDFFISLWFLIWKIGGESAHLKITNWDAAKPLGAA